MSGQSSSKKTYWMVFGGLFLFTVLEVVVALPSLGIAQVPKAVALVSMALVKAAMVMWFFMHLNHERRALKLTVFLPFAFPALYAFVLIAEAGWRLIR
jgi:cytochrome c oxidase subunit 4